MSRVLTIARRELSGLFCSPIAYVVLFLFLLFMSIVFFLVIFKPGGAVDLRELFDYSRFSLFFVVPLLTMSTFSDEYRSGRIEMLRTSPVTEFDLLLGKFIGMMTYYLVLVASTLIYLFILMIWGKPDLGQVISGYFGMVLMGCMFVAVGLFFSACTREQIVAALAGMITLGSITILSYFTGNIPREFSMGKFTLAPRAFAEFLSVRTHITEFAQGTIALNSVTYFLGFALLFLFWTYVLLESRKWR